MNERCSQIQDSLGRYHDGEMAPAERAAFEQHLLACAECAAAVKEVRGIVGLLRSYEVTIPDLPGEALDRLHALAEDSGQVVDLSLRRFVGILSSVAAALLVVASVGLLTAPHVSAEPAAPWEKAVEVLQVNPAPAEPLNTARLISLELSQQRQANHD